MKFLVLVFAFLAFSAPLFADTLVWDKNPDAVYYTIYIRDFGQTDADYKVLREKITELSYPLITTTINKDFEYSIKAFNEYGSSSDFATPVRYNPYKVKNVMKVMGLKITVTFDLPVGVK